MEGPAYAKALRYEIIGLALGATSTVQYTTVSSGAHGDVI